MFGLFKRDATRIPDRLAHAGPPRPEPCGVSYCTSTTTWECTYTDASGAVCGTHWCPDHLLVVDRAPFCRRHAGVASLLLTRVGTLMEMPVPPVADRSLPILLRIASQLDERVTGLLHHLYQQRRDVHVSPHAAVRDYREQGRVAGWQAQWTATGQTGHLTVIGLRSSLGDPPSVSIVRDGRLLAEGAPNWIQRRDEDGWNGPADTAFIEGLFSALVATFSTPSGGLAG